MNEKRSYWEENAVSNVFFEAMLCHPRLKLPTEVEIRLIWLLYIGLYKSNKKQFLFEFVNARLEKFSIKNKRFCRFLDSFFESLIVFYTIFTTKSTADFQTARMLACRDFYVTLYDRNETSIRLDDHVFFAILPLQNGTWPEGLRTNCFRTFCLRKEIKKS